MLETSELRTIVQGIDHEGFDEEHEIKRAVSRSLRFLDSNQDDLVDSNLDVTNFLSRWTSLLTVNEVLEWLEFAVLLPQYKSQFEHSSVTGL